MTAKNTERPYHHEGNGLFRNNYLNERKTLKDLLKWRRNRENIPASIAFPHHVAPLAELQSNRTRPSITWIGHVTFLLQLDGVNFLTDPHFSGRAFPLSFLGPKRTTPLGIALKDLPHIDVVLLSHNHYDHLDAASILALAKKQKGKAPLFVVPLGVKAWFIKRGIENVLELDWWQSTDFHHFKIQAVPAQHWSRRNPFDTNRSLWCGFVIEHEGKRVYFAGDTGYSRDFKDIREKVGAMRLALIPIAAYAPRWFMKSSHIDPEEAVQVHLDLESSYSVGMHWGTFPLTDEPMDEPPKKLAVALKAAGVKAEQFTVMAHGETRWLEKLWLE